MSGQGPASAARSDDAGRTGAKRLQLGWPASFLGLAGLFGLHRIVDPDLFQLAAIGRKILSSPGSLGVSGFIAGFPDQSYVEDKWLFSVLAALVERIASGNGFMLLQIGLVAGVAGSWWILLRRVCGAGSPAAAALGAFGLVAMAFRLEPRPETVSHALLALSIALVLAPPGRLSMRVRLGATVLLAIAWINIHGYFINGLLVLAAACLAAWLGDRSVPGPRECLMLMGAALASSVVHPQGVRALAWPVRQLAVLGREPVLRASILEFFPTADLFAGLGTPRAVLLGATLPAAFLFDQFAPQGRGRRLVAGFAAALPWLVAPPPGFVPWPYRATLALVIAASFQVPGMLRERRFFLPILLGGFLLLAWPLVRNLSLLVPVSLAILATTLAGIERGILMTSSRLTAFRRAAGACAACALLLVAWARGTDHLAPGTARAPGWTGWGIDEVRFPAAGAGFIARERASGRILNTFDAGGFLLDRLGPDRAVFIAGNTSQYPSAWLEEYRESVMGGREDPSVLQERYGVTTIVLEHAAMDTPNLIARLAGSRDWALVSLDDAGAVWVRRDPESAVLIAQLEVPESAFAALADRAARKDDSPIPAFLLPRRRLFPALNSGIFLRAAGRPRLAMEMARSMWDRAPAAELASFIAAAAEESGVLPAQVEFLESAHERFPRSGPVGSVLARACYIRALSGAIADPRSDLLRAIELAPTEPGPWLAFAKLEGDAGRMEEATRRLRVALSLDRDGSIRRFAENDPALRKLDVE